jgi:hypothetical protein
MTQTSRACNRHMKTTRGEVRVPQTIIDCPSNGATSPSDFQQHGPERRHKGQDDHRPRAPIRRGFSPEVDREIHQSTLAPASSRARLETESTATNSVQRVHGSPAAKAAQVIHLQYGSSCAGHFTAFKCLGAGDHPGEICCSLHFLRVRGFTGVLATDSVNSLFFSCGRAWRDARRRCSKASGLVPRQSLTSEQTSARAARLSPVWGPHTRRPAPWSLYVPVLYRAA